MSQTSTTPSRSRWITTLAVGLFLALVAAGATWWAHHQGYTQYYGDAQAHLNIARRMVDTRTPGMLQVGTVWLPLPHVLMTPLVKNDELWANGLAGAIPVSICFWIAGMLLFLATRRVLGSSWAALATTCVLAMNPNVLYIQAAPMTEAIFFAVMAGIFYGCTRFAATQHLGWAIWTAFFALAGTLTRYDGWFLLPFVAAFLLWKGQNRRWVATALFCVIAGAGPLWWLAHNWWFWGDPLEFYRGAYSAKAIYARQLAAGMAPYPGDHDYLESARYFLTAAQLSAGWPLLIAGLLGALALLPKAPHWPVALLALPAIFYVESMHNAGTPIFVPSLWPHAYYNTRYSLALFPLLCLGVGAWVYWTPPRFRPLSVAILLLACSAPWLLLSGPDSWVVWKESDVNSRNRRVWLGEAATYMKRLYQPGGGILLSFGDPAGVLQLGGIPLREAIHEDNHPMYRAAVNKPEFFLWAEWAICQSGDQTCRGMQRAVARGMLYDRVKVIRAGNSAPLEIWRRQSEFRESNMTLPRKLLPPLPPMEDNGEESDEDWDDEP